MVDCLESESLAHLACLGHSPRHLPACSAERVSAILRGVDFAEEHEKEQNARTDHRRPTWADADARNGPNMAAVLFKGAWRAL